MRQLVLISIVLAIPVDGHGRLVEPPSRNAMWRAGFKNPPNYNDNQLNCGGFSFQWISNGGKCGVCGDPFGKEQQHVYPGKYANNIITRTYRKGQSIEIKVEITANHKGYFKFEIGDIGTPPITEPKLNNVLRISGTGNTKYYLPKGSGAGIFIASLQLPQTLTCKHCVLRWTYIAGNSWGTDANGSGIGNGAQETFVNCADVSIEVDNSRPQTTTEAIVPVTTRKPSSTTEGMTTKAIPTSARETTKKLSSQARTATQPLMTTLTTISPHNQKCRGAGSYAGQQGMDAWCDSNCPRFCPKSHCTCSATPPSKQTCRGAGAYKHVVGMDSWCRLNCPGFCPKSHCVCA